MKAVDDLLERVLSGVGRRIRLPPKERKHHENNRV